MNKKPILLILLISVLLAACHSNNTNEEIASKDIKEIVQAYSTDKIIDQTASITSDELIIIDKDNKETIYDLPEEEFFVSIAPFINETHPCEIHSLTGCQGEMANQDFDIYIEDSNGNIIIDETRNTEANGFIDLWLPRGETYHVSISHEGKQVESEISTFDNDYTCITTMELS